MVSLYIVCHVAFFFFLAVSLTRVFSPSIPGLCKQNTFNWKEARVICKQRVMCLAWARGDEQYDLASSRATSHIRRLQLNASFRQKSRLVCDSVSDSISESNQTIGSFSPLGSRDGEQMPLDSVEVELITPLFISIVTPLGHTLFESSGVEVNTVIREYSSRVFIEVFTPCITVSQSVSQSVFLHEKFKQAYSSKV